MPDWLLFLAPILAASLVLLLGFAGCSFRHGEIGRTDLLFYERADGQGEFWASEGEGSIRLLGETHTDWRNSWALIIPGKFGSGPRTDCLFYDRVAGEGEFWSTSGAGGISLIGETNTGWRENWALIVPGRFGPENHRTDLLFYDRRAGQGEFWAANGSGGISMIGETNSGWRTSWALIVPGRFGPENHRTDLLFYDRATGQGEFWAANGDGTISMIGETNSGWRTSWTNIVPGSFGGNNNGTDLLFYDRAAGEGEFWAANGDGTISMIGTTNLGWRTTWGGIIPGNFSDDSTFTDLLFYDANAGVGEFWAANGSGSVSLIGATHSDWRTTWSLITRGSFA